MTRVLCNSYIRRVLTRAQKQRRNAELAKDDGKGVFRRISYQEEYIVCCKPRCWCARRLKAYRRFGGSLCAHGPYWYAYWREGGRVVSRYLGKERRTIKVRR